MTPFPTGVPLAILPDFLHPVSSEHDSTPIATFDLESRLSGKPNRENSRIFPHHPEWKSTLDLKQLSGCSREEICKIWFSSQRRVPYDGLFSGRRPENVPVDPIYRLVGKLQNSLFAWSQAHGPGWNQLSAAYRAVRNFDFAVPGFSVHVDHADSILPSGPPEHAEANLEDQRTLWYDGSLAYLIHFRGRHVLTLGFSLSADGYVLLQQIQNRSPRGNRWLYRLPQPLFDHVLQRFEAAFAPEFHLHLIHPEDLRKQIQNSFGTNPQSIPSREVLTRIEKQYASSLKHYHRGSPPLVRRNCRFHPLHKRPQPSTPIT